MRTLAIGILTYNRDELLKRTLESLFQFNVQKDLVIVLVDNGSDEKYQVSNRKYAEQYGIKYKYNEIEPSIEMNTKIEIGHQVLIKELLKCKEDLYCILEDDWECIGQIPVEEIGIFLEKHREVGQVRIRDYRYDDTFYGGSSRHFITSNKIVFDETEEVNGKQFQIADMHWVNCCNVMRREVINYMGSSFHNEYEKMQLFYKSYPRNAQFEPGIFFHIGPRRIRQDLREKGLFCDENIS